MFSFFTSLNLAYQLLIGAWIVVVAWVGLVIYFSYGRYHSKVQSHVVEEAAASGR